MIGFIAWESDDVGHELYSIAFPIRIGGQVTRKVLQIEWLSAHSVSDVTLTRERIA